MDLDNPSWSILKLPNEILGRIVELCDVQDKVTEQRLERLSETGIGEHVEEYAKSLDPLSLTCERIRSLAAPFLFSSVNINTGVKPTFRCRILPKYSRHIRRVDLANVKSDTSTATVEFLIIASCLPCVDTLELGPSTLYKLYDWDCSEDSAKLQAALLDDSETSIALRTLLSRTKHLRIKDIKNFYQWHPLLSLANPHLSSVALDHLRFGLEEVTDSTFVLLVSDLQQFTKLIKFSVIRVPAVITLLNDTENLEWRLRHLELGLGTLKDSEVQFISLFADTLEILEVETDDDFTKATGSAIFSRPMPLLTTLTVVDTSEAYQATPANFTPSLRHLFLQSSEPYTSPLAAFVPEHLTKLPTLSSLSFSPRSHEAPILSHRQTTTLSEIPNLHISFDRRGFNPMLADCDELEKLNETSAYVMDEEYVRRRHGPIEDVIQFGARYNERLLNTQDKSGMDRFIEALRPLKLLQDFQED